MVIIDSDLKIVKSSYIVGSADSLGGAMDPTKVVSESVHSLWDKIEDSEISSSVVGEYEVRCVYAANFSPTNELMEDVWVWIEQQTVSPYTDIDIGLGTAPVGSAEQTVANENSLPLNIFWTSARNEQEALLCGNISKGDGKSIWIRRHAGPARSGSSTPSDNYVLMFKMKKSTGAGGGPGPGPGPGPIGNDPFGVRMIYNTNTSSSVSGPFYINMDNPLSDCRFGSSGPITKNSDGSWSVGVNPRIRMYTSVAGCSRDIIHPVTLDTYNHDIWGDRGYMFKPNDWKNVEITGYFRVVTTDPDVTDQKKIYLYSRTLRHNVNKGGGCSGSAYKGVIYGEGELKWHKESFHGGIDQPCGDRDIESFKTGIFRSDQGSWFGMKFIMWNYDNPNSENPGAQYVHMELWLDENATNQWIKHGERNDTGGWYPGYPDPNCPGDEYCGGNQDQIITWGGPVTEVRGDSSYTNIAFRWLSCREIVPTIITPPEPPEPPPTIPVDVFGIKHIYTSEVGGDLWQSTLWANGTNRTIPQPEFASECEEDPNDSRLKMSGAGDGNVNINGAGTMKTGVTGTNTSGSPRVMVSGAWQNVEQTAYVRCPAGAQMGTNVDLRCKTDHYCVEGSDNFGGYIINFSWEGQHAAVRKEKTHAIGYGPVINTQPVSLLADVWYGFKSICYNLPNGNVKLEAWLDTTGGTDGGTWTKVTEGIDDGSWLGTPDTLVSQGSAVRSNVEAGTNAATYLEFKWASSRSIIPPTGAGTTVQTLWDSTAWTTGGTRTLDPNEVDPNDSKVDFWAEPGGTCVISGSAAGTATLNGITPRIYINTNHTNATLTTFVTANSGLSTINLNIRANHDDNCRFGGYQCHFDWENNEISITKEPVHGIFGDKQSIVSLSTLGITLTTGVSTGIRSKIETLTDNSVKISAFILDGTTWRLVTSYTDTDANTDGLATLDASEQTRFNECATLGDLITSSAANMYKPWRGSGFQCWIRANGIPITTAVTGIVFTNSSLTSP